MKAEGIWDFREKARYYIMDIGNEIFDYIDLKRRIARLSKIALGTPAFATLGNDEIDFFIKNCHLRGSMLSK